MLLLVLDYKFLMMGSKLDCSWCWSNSVNAIDVQVAADASYVLAVAGTLGGNKIYKSNTGDVGTSSYTTTLLLLTM